MLELGPCVARFWPLTNARPTTIFQRTDNLCCELLSPSPSLLEPPDRRLPPSSDHKRRPRRLRACPQQPPQEETDDEDRARRHLVGPPPPIDVIPGTAGSTTHGHTRRQQRLAAGSTRAFLAPFQSTATQLRSPPSPSHSPSPSPAPPVRYEHGGPAAAIEPSPRLLTHRPRAQTNSPRSRPP